MGNFIKGGNYFQSFHKEYHAMPNSKPKRERQLNKIVNEAEKEDNIIFRFNLAGLAGVIASLFLPIPFLGKIGFISLFLLSGCYLEDE